MISAPGIDFATLRALATGAETDAICPLCAPQRVGAAARRQVLHIWDDGEGFLTYNCARCEAHGYAHAQHAAHTAPQPRPPGRQTGTNEKAELARWLWERARPLAGSPAETYLHSRRCYAPSPSLRFLPGRDPHPPAMIASFSGAPGVHLTKLKADGTGKADIDKAKIMLGPSAGYPIMLTDNAERSELVITEGIEDALSYALVTGWTAWAAGAAGRIPRVLARADGFERVFIGVDGDDAGAAALAQARSVRPDVIPLPLARALGARMDANRVLANFGADVLLAAIEWCEAQDALRCKRIGFHEMQRQVARAEDVFRALLGGAL
jgi:Toprim domain